MSWLTFDLQTVNASVAETISSFKAVLLIKLLIFMAAIYQGYRMIKRKKESEEIFQKWAFNNEDIRVYGWLTIISVVLIFNNTIGFWAELVTAFSMFITLSVQLSIHNRKGFWVEIPFFLIVIYLMYAQACSGILPRL